MGSLRVFTHVLLALLIVRHVAVAEDGAPSVVPQLVKCEPARIPRGVATTVLLVGQHLDGFEKVVFETDGIVAKADGSRESTPKSLWVEVTAQKDVPAGRYDLRVVTAAGKSGKIPIVVDDLEAVSELEPNDHTARSTHASRLPVLFLGAVKTKGDTDCFSFEVSAGQTIVLDLAAARFGSKIDAVLTLVGEGGELLSSVNDFDGDRDPFIAFTAPADGRYTAQVTDHALGASPDHFYQLAVGPLPFVTSVFPLSGAAHGEVEVELAGYNLPSDRIATKLGDPREEVIVAPGSLHFRSRRDFRIVAGSLDLDEVIESEPNDTPSNATPLPRSDAVVGGRIWNQRRASNRDVDLFRFESEAGKTWVIETDAARRGSPVDTKVEVLDGDGNPVQRAILQAVRDSYITFRSVDADLSMFRVANWEEMALNEWVYFNGEVCKIHKMPQGPDSGIFVYTFQNIRVSYFGTSPTVHPVDETCYIVEPHAPGTNVAANGLPVFPVFYENDDDGDRELGKDSRVLFEAPYTGSFLVRVTDVNGNGGDRYVYRLAVRESHPDFAPKLRLDRSQVHRGSATNFTVAVDRHDGFEADVHFEISGLPTGWSASTPLVVQPGHLEAKGALVAGPWAPSPSGEDWDRVQVVATAMVDGRTVKHEVNNFGVVELAGQPNLLVQMEPVNHPGWDPWDWQALAPVSATSESGTALTIRDDRSILATGENPDLDTYDVVVRTDLRGITAFRLETITDPSLPDTGPGRAPGSGNFVLTEFRVALRSESDGRSDSKGKEESVKLEKASADYSQLGWNVAHAIDGKTSTGWAVATDDADAGFPVDRSRWGGSHHAVFETSEPVGAAGSTAIVFRLEQKFFGKKHNVGCFRISASTATLDNRLRPPPIAEIVVTPGETRSAMLKVVRDTFQGRVAFDVNNLPHGVIVDNIGLNGILILEGQTEREIFLTTADWVPETTRLCHAVAKDASQASFPVRVRVKR